jgi:hypothetical protein
LSDTAAPQSSKIRLTLSPQAEKYARRDAPIEARRMAARGALPLEPIELATVLFALLHDPEAEIKEAAQASLGGLPDNVCTVVLEGNTHPAVLSFLAHAHKDREERCQQIALNNHTDDATVAFLASLSHRSVVDVVSQNQERMLRCDDIVEALGANPLTGRAVIERILNFLGVSPDEEEKESELSIESMTEEQTQAALSALLGEDMAHLAGPLASEADPNDDGDDVLRSGNLFAAVQKMSVLQKIKLARLGGKEARSLLIRDRNKIVAVSVIQSPKMTDSEVVGIAQSRNVSDEILRLISINNSWTRNYQIKQALATNPKTPLSSAIKFLNYLQDKDLKTVMKSKDVPTAISTHARRILNRKGRI